MVGFHGDTIADSAICDQSFNSHENARSRLAGASVRPQTEQGEVATGSVQRFPSNAQQFVQEETE